MSDRTPDPGDLLCLGWGRRGLRRRLHRPGEHVKIAARPDFAAALAAHDGELPAGAAWTIVRTGDDAPIACGGLSPSWPCVGDFDAWGYCADMTARQWWFAAQAAKDVLEHHVPAGAWVWTIAPDARPAAGRLLERLGFRRGRAHTGVDGAAYHTFVFKKAR